MAKIAEMTIEEMQEKKQRLANHIVELMLFIRDAERRIQNMKDDDWKKDFDKNQIRLAKQLIAQYLDEVELIEEQLRKTF